MASPNEGWISQGMGLLTGESCPFCSQNIKDNELVSAYRTYFNKEYDQLKSNVANLKKRINEAIGSAKLLPVQKKISDNLNLLEFWKEYIEEAELPEISFDEIQNTYEKLLGDCLTSADKKQSNPLDAVTLDEEFKKKQNNIQELKKTVIQYNDTVKILNKKISSFKQSLPSEGDISECKKKLYILKIHKTRFEEDTVKAVESYNAIQKIKRELEKEKNIAKDCLDKYCEEILSQYENSINLYLSSFNTGFSITNSKHNYKGGTPSSQYELKINNTPVGLEQFKTSMSAGDRSALALAFFLASLEHDPELHNKIVVLDDPFTSLDRFRRECTAQLSHKLAEKAKQVIILSHDPQFLKLVYDRHSSTEPKTLQLSKCSNGSVIMEWDINTELQSPYIKNYSILLAFYRDRDGDKTAVARAIRPFLEGWLRTHFPGHFQDNEWLGDFISKIQNSNDDSGLAHAKQDLEKIDAINSYSKDFHHDQNPNADSIVINEDELHGFVSSTLALVGGS
jgi:wobble nucleotide-excising tRNase